MTVITPLAALLAVAADKHAVEVIRNMLVRLRALDMEPQDTFLIDEFETAFLEDVQDFPFPE